MSVEASRRAVRRFFERVEAGVGLNRSRCRKQANRALRFDRLEERQLLAVGANATASEVLAADPTPGELVAEQIGDEWPVDTETASVGPAELTSAGGQSGTSLSAQSSVLDVSINEFIPGLEPRPGYHSVHGVTLSPGETELYAAYWTAGLVFPSGGEPLGVYSTADNSLLDTMSYGTCHGDVVISPDGRYAFTQNYYEGTVSRFDLANDALRTDLPAGRWAGAIGLSPDGNTLVVGSGMEGQNGGVADRLYLYDVSGDNFSEIGEVLLADEIKGRDFTFSADSQFVYFGSLKRTSAHARVYEISLAESHEVRSVEIEGAERLRSVAVDGDRLLASGPGHSTVWEIDRESFTPTGSIDVPHEAGDLTVHPDGRHLFVLHQEERGLSVVDLSSDEVVTTYLATGDDVGLYRPTDIAFTSDGRTAYVAEYSVEHGGITVLDVAPAGIDIDVTSSSGQFAMRPDQTLPVTVGVGDTPAALIGYQLDFAGSDIGEGQLRLENWQAADPWGFQLDTSLNAPGDTRVAAGAFPGIAGPTDLGSFDVAAPSAPGRYLLSLNDATGGPFSTAFVGLSGAMPIVDYGEVTVLVDGAAPEAQLVAPAADRWTNRDLGYVDVQWSDPGPYASGIDQSTVDTNDIAITDSQGQLSVDRVEFLGEGLFRYHYGDDGESLSEGPVTVTFAVGEVADAVGNGNVEAAATFSLDATSPEDSLAEPLPGEVIGQDHGYVDVRWSDPGPSASGVDSATLDTGDIRVESNGAELSVDRMDYLGDGVCRYHYGDDGETLADGPVTVTFVGGAVTDLAENGNPEGQSEFHFDATAPTVVGVAINTAPTDPADLPSGPQPTSWAAQRSDLRSLIVTFSEEVSLTASDLRLTNLGVDAPQDGDFDVPLDDAHLSLSGDTLTITFASYELPDGVYSLEIMPTVTDAVGHPLDGNADGTPDDSFVLSGDAQNRLYKLAGDFNGDSGVSIADLPAVTYWFGQTVPGAAEYVDMNVDGGVSILDYAEFMGSTDNQVVFPAAPISLQQIETPGDATLIDAALDDLLAADSNQATPSSNDTDLALRWQVAALDLAEVSSAEEHDKVETSHEIDLLMLAGGPQDQ